MKNASPRRRASVAAVTARRTRPIEPQATETPERAASESAGESEIVLLEPIENEEPAESGQSDSDPRDTPADTLLHTVYLAIAVGIILLSLVLRVRGEQQVLLPWIDQPLPEACTAKRLFHIGCPGCGLTRSLISLAHGDLARSWRFNPVGPLIAVLVCLQVPYRAAQLWRIRRGLPELNAQRWGTRIVLVLAVALFVQWAVKLVANGL